MILVSCRGLLDGVTASEAFETALKIGGIAWGFGYAVAYVLDYLAHEHVAVLAGQTAEAAEAETISADRVSPPELNN